MRHFLLMLFILLKSTAFSQRLATLISQIPLSGYYTKLQHDTILKSSHDNVKPPVILPECKAGPDIIKIQNVTKTSAEIQFHGNDVWSIEYEIRHVDNQLVVKDSVRPENNVVKIKFPAQSGGIFELIFRGRSCKSNDSKKLFTIKNSFRNTNFSNQSLSSSKDIKILARGMEAHLNLAIKDSADVRIISDIATEGRGFDYSYRYIINGHIVTQKERLTNYLVAGNNPIRVLKFKLRDGLSTINHWGTGQEKYGGYYQYDAGELFSFNTSFAFNTMVLVGPKKKVGFLHHIPQNYNPENQVPSWADIAPDMQMPIGHIWIGDWHGWTAEHVYKKGITHLPHHQLPWNDADGNKNVIALKNAGKTYNNVPRIETILGLTKNGVNDYSNGWNRAWWPNGPLDSVTARMKADQADISDAIWIGETMENEAWMNADAEMWRHFYARLRERYEDRFGKRGIPFHIVHNYFFMWPREISLSRDKPADYYRKLLITKPADLPKTAYSPGGVLSKTTMITQAIYLGAPDIQTGVLYESIFRIEVNKILGYESGIFLMAVHEYRPNNKYQFHYPDGKFYTDKKIPLDPNVHIAAGFIAQVYGKLFVEWGAAAKKDHKRQSFEWAKGLWYPNGSDTPQNNFPHYSYTSDYYGGFDGGSDLSYFSQKLYNDTFGQTDGGHCQYLTHRIDGGKWIRPNQANAQEVVNAYAEKRGFTYAQSKDGKIAWFYLNSYADNNWHTLDVQLPNGKVKTFRVAGNGIHARLDRSF